MKNLISKDSASSLFGAYQVETFVLNKDTLPPLVTDTLRWNKFLVPWEKNAVVMKMNDSLKRYGFEVNEKLQTFILKRRDSTQNMFFAYSKPAPDQLILFGKFRNDSLYIGMKKMRFELEKHRFRLINDDPYK